MDIRTFKCRVCDRVFEDTLAQFGGFSIEMNADMCKECWGEYIPMKNRHNKETEDWLNSKKGAK